MASRSIEKTKFRLQQRIQEGSYYEAHQQLRVVSQRYAKSGNYDDAINILSSGARSLLNAGQSGSAGDLCLLMLDIYKIARLVPSSASKARVFELVSMIPSEEPSRKRIINDWTSKCGEYSAGDPELHHFIGALFAQENDAYEAEKHLLLGTIESASALAVFLYQWYREDEAHTAPLYIARAVLPYIILGKLKYASRSLDVFVHEILQQTPELSVQEAHSTLETLHVYPSLPLLNFLALLLLAIPRGGHDAYSILQSHYAPNLKEIPAWNDALEQIGEIYFDVPIRRSHSLFDMMGSLFDSNRQQRPRELASSPSLD